MCMYCILLLFFFFQCAGDHRDLHSFPTRRSSDLKGRQLAADAGFTSGDQTVIAAAISEIARNILMYARAGEMTLRDRKSTRLNSSHVRISYAVFCLKKKKK